MASWSKCGQQGWWLVQIWPLGSLRVDIIKWAVQWDTLPVKAPGLNKWEKKKKKVQLFPILVFFFHDS